MTVARRIGLLALVGAAIGLGFGEAQAAGGGHRSPPIGAYTTRGAWSFVSAPRLHPPRIKTDARVEARSLAPGLFLLTNLPDTATTKPLVGEGGPLILNSKLQPVWVYPVGTHLGAADLEQQTYHGKPVLTWWQGTVNRVGLTGSGTDVVVDQHYRRMATLRAAAPWVISEHEMLITPDGHAWVTVYRYARKQDLSTYGGSRRGTVYDSGVQEYDLASGKLLYTWDALNPGGSANIPLSESKLRPSRQASAPWDAYHINSVQVMGTSQFLISMRNTWGVYLIDKATGRVVWKLGGKHSTFRIAADARFQFQHDVKLSGSQLTMFDDACCGMTPSGSFGKPYGPSRGLILHVDFANHTVALAHQYVHHPKLDTFFLGSTRILPGGNVLVGWGSLPYFSEYSASGRQLLDAVLPGSGKDISYRVLFTPRWVGTPSYPPSAAVRRRRGTVTVYASWNGATEVAKWEVLAGSGATHPRPVARATKTGFETAVRLRKGNWKSFQVKALDAAGRVIGSTGVLR